MSGNNGEVDLVPNPNDKGVKGSTVNLLWLILVCTLAAVIVISLLASVLLIALGLDASLIVGIGSAALTGLLGLFVSPSTGGEPKQG
ncbi:hypothetical protein [Humibacter ginsenosidimutans]|uniref:Uncharacterized protein n=1 Tax=Humibacter ginsenosidimutans TaxID=2599293 RepID=A0A5B8LZ28_9MICO|nr:hypothetical protein [Humibacter ginsenosidimutans]QDZ13607.1 hypothetical protein FPZ11_01245 [Humibacter ginsenosidimutans]